MVKIGQVDLETICFKGLISKNEGLHADDPLKRLSCWIEFHQIYTQYRQMIADKLFKKQNGDIAISFGISGLRIKVNSPIFANFDPMATSLYRSIIYDRIPTIW